MPVHDENKNPYKYDVCLSFAGEDRPYIKRVAKYLNAKSVQVFYDEYEEATLWGKDLSIHIDEVYSKKAKYCVIFISEHYAKKVWPNQEFRSALARAVEHFEEYILPARFDSTELPGLRKTIVYIDLNNKKPKDLGDLIRTKRPLGGLNRKQS